MRWPALLGALLLVGCLQVNAPQADGATPDDGRKTLQATIVDEGSGKGLQGAQVTLSIPGKDAVRKSTDGDGQATFTVDPVPSCSLAVERGGYHGSAVALDCREDRAFRIPLKAVPIASPSESPSRPPLPGPSAAPPGGARLHGAVLDLATGAPVAGATVRLDPPSGQAMRTGADGLYAFDVVPGHHVLATEAPCRVRAEVPIDVVADMILDLRLAPTGTPPGAPGGVRATPGPGPSMVTVSWQPVDGATGYRLLRGGQPFHVLGNSQAYGIPGATEADRFAVSAVACGVEGAASAPVSSPPLPGPEPIEPGPVRFPATIDIDEHAYPAWTPDGRPAGERGWRVVTGIGNCCENYLAVTPQGRILNQGASQLVISDDEGRSWTELLAPGVLNYGEGSVANAPDGDVVAFDWTTYNGDTAFAYRYSAATQTWATMPVARQPFFDRPWIGTIKGPFELDGLVVPYVTIVQGHSGVVMSLDGLHYVPTTLNLAQGMTDLAPLVPQPDANHDWTAPNGEVDILTVRNGLGFADLEDNVEGNVEPTAALSAGLRWTGVTLPQVPGRILRIDSAASLHALDAEYGVTEMRYSWSHDGGSTWTGQVIPLEGRVRHAELLVNAALDQVLVMVAVHLTTEPDEQLGPGPEIPNRFLLYRFRGLAGQPVLAEILDVGNGDHPLNGFQGQGDRFDFLSMGLLPSGKAVVSFADLDHFPAAVAIEL